jgi:hypothetical protein
MNYGKEFKKFATKHHGVNNLYYDKIVNNDANQYDTLSLKNVS